MTQTNYDFKLEHSWYWIRPYFVHAYHQRCENPVTGTPESLIDGFGCKLGSTGGLGRSCPATDTFGGPLECVTMVSGRGYAVAGFDNIALGMLTVFQCTTQAGWTQVLYRVMDSGSEFAVPYFVLLMFLGPYFVVNLFLAVLKTKFGKAQSLFQSKIVKKGNKQNTLAAAGTRFTGVIGRYMEGRRLAAHAREQDLVRKLEESDGAWSWRIEYMR